MEDGSIVNEGLAVTEEAAPIEVLGRFSGELSTKAKRTRTRFEKRLAKNIVDACRSHGLRCRVTRGWSRLHVFSPDPGILDP